MGELGQSVQRLYEASKVAHAKGLIEYRRSLEGQHPPVGPTECWAEFEALEEALLDYAEEMLKAVKGELASGWVNGR